jgi:hypothetical protein
LQEKSVPLERFTLPPQRILLPREGFLLPSKKDFLPVEAWTFVAQRSAAPLDVFTAASEKFTLASEAKFAAIVIAATRRCDAAKITELPPVSTVIKKICVVDRRPPNETHSLLASIEKGREL